MFLAGKAAGNGAGALESRHHQARSTAPACGGRDGCEVTGHLARSPACSPPRAVRKWVSALCSHGLGGPQSPHLISS